MNTIECTPDNKLYFSCWCRKGYAVFAALGREVRIAGLAIHVCESALLKSGRKGIIVDTAECSLRADYSLIDFQECFYGQQMKSTGNGKEELCPDFFGGIIRKIRKRIHLLTGWCILFPFN